MEHGMLRGVWHAAAAAERVEEEVDVFEAEIWPRRDEQGLGVHLEIAGDSHGRCRRFAWRIMRRLTWRSCGDSYENHAEIRAMRFEYDEAVQINVATRWA